MANDLLPSPMPLYEEAEEEEEACTEMRPPQTGTTLPFIWPPPTHLRTSAPFEEPVLPCPPSESLLARETKLDALRCEDPSSHQGRQVYDSLDPPPRDNYNDARGATSAEDMPQWYVLDGRADDTILFESRFESGNLRSAERIDESEYNLQLAFDINTDRHTLWFYFRMSNLRKGRLYKLNLQNLMKPHALYNQGMQPLAYSEVRAEAEGVGWYRTGSETCYFKNQVTRAGLKPFWTLTFVVGAMYDQDTLYLAHCFPYRYSDLQRYLKEKEAMPLPPSVAIRRRTLCKTLAGNDCDMLTITSPSGNHAKKKGVVISARVHPGETNASWMMKGVLDYLTSDKPQAITLREKFVFKIVPMLNPDGVIVGNQRCSLAASDLNRQYEDPKRELFPEVLNLKQIIANFGLGKEVLLYVDLHGHSKKKNMFMYGVGNPTDETLYMRERVMPTLLDRANPLFHLGNCTFDVGKGKEGCGRVVARRQLGIVNAYTLEASFMGADQGDFRGLHFNQGHYETMGHSLCEAMLELVDPDQSKVESIVRQLVEKYPIDQSRVVSKRDLDGDGGGDTSDDSNTEAPPRQSAKAPPKPPTAKAPSKLPTAKPPPKPPKRGLRKSRTGADSGAGPGRKTTPRERGGVRSVNSSSEGENNYDEIKEVGRKGSKTTRSSSSSSKYQKPKQPKPVPRVPPPAQPAPPACYIGAVILPQNSPPPKPPSAKAVQPNGGATKTTVASNSSESRGGTQKTVTPKISTNSGKKTDAKARRVKAKGATVVARKGDPSPEEDTPAVGYITVAPEVASNDCFSHGVDGAAARGDGAIIGALEEHQPASRSGGKSVGPKRSNASPISASLVGKGGATGTTTTKKKAEKWGTAASGGRMAPGRRHGPARRPASSPASRSVGSPRRHAAAAASRRSPSAPPNPAAGSRRVGVGVGAAEEGKVGGGRAPGAPRAGKSSSGRGKGRHVRRTEELPTPPLRSNLLPGKKILCRES